MIRRQKLVKNRVWRQMADQVQRVTWAQVSGRAGAVCGVGAGVATDAE